jgi:hypothetical protein
MALGSTQPLVKMSIRDVPGGKGGRCVRLTTYHLIMPMSGNLGALTLLDPSGPAWPVMGVLYLYLYYDIFVNCNWVDTRWQYYSTHLHTNNTQNNTMIQNTQNIT